MLCKSVVSSDISIKQKRKGPLQVQVEELEHMSVQEYKVLLDQSTQCRGTHKTTGQIKQCIWDSRGKSVESLSSSLYPARGSKRSNSSIKNIIGLQL